MALSWPQYCITTKTSSKAPEVAKRAMTRALSQWYLVPPHCSANSRLMIAGRKNNDPSRSNCLSCCFQLVLLFSALGALKKKRMKKNVTAPMGRLM